MTGIVSGIASLRREGLMYRTKWMIIHGLDATEDYLMDYMVKELAIKIKAPEEFVWQTIHEAALHNQSRLYLGLTMRGVTWIIKRVFGEADFNKVLEQANQRLDEIRESALRAVLTVVSGEEPADDRSQAN
jgi:hypothetical protein